MNKAPMPGRFDDDGETEKRRVAKLAGYEPCPCSICGAYTVIKLGLDARCDTCCRGDKLFADGQK